MLDEPEPEELFSAGFEVVDDDEPEPDDESLDEDDEDEDDESVEPLPEDEPDELLLVFPPRLSVL